MSKFLAFPPSPGVGARLAIRLVEDRTQHYVIRRSVLQPIECLHDRGAMVTVWRAHGVGYCATADLSDSGLRKAAEIANGWALLAERHGIYETLDLFDMLDRCVERGLGRRAFLGEPMPERAGLVNILRDEAEGLRVDPRIVSWVASLSLTQREQSLWAEGECIGETLRQFVAANLEATASEAGCSQTRTLGGQYGGWCQQGGFEALRASGLIGAGSRIAREALALLGAPQCPSGERDLLLMPDQMMLQIHESIGHPLELDRILGDERNFAGGSFVTLEDFGHYRYGSELLNVSFDPGVSNEVASYEFDDEGEPAHKVMLIEDGILQRPLGGALSRARAQAQGFAFDGTASSRAVSWFRAPIDRMANLNVEPGETSLAEMISAVEHGVLMRTNASWSIDDARNKFQFGCEWGQLIEQGQLTQVVRNPGYRGISANFWRSLAAVGDPTTLEIHGTPFCGKGEPGQVIRVGHASPPCLFRKVVVFGGQA